MQLTSLSASSALVYEACPARWKAEYEQRVYSPGGDAANLGTACHGAMQRYVEDGYHLGDVPYVLKAKHISRMFNEEYDKLFSDESRRAEGRELVVRWATRTNFEGLTVLSTERKREIQLATRHGNVPFRFVMDLELAHYNGDIEVVDYKTYARPVPIGDLKNRIQCRAYAAMAHLMHPDAARIWVTFDLLRFEPIGVVFTRDECIETLDYLVRLAERIIEDENPQETINPECRFCVRKERCQKLSAYSAFKGAHSPDASLADQVKTLLELQQAKGAIEDMIKRLEPLILMSFDDTEEDRIELDDHVLTLSSSRRRVIDMDRLIEVLPGHDLAAIATVGISKLDELLASGTLEPETASRVRQTITWRLGKQTLKINKR